MRSNFYQVEDRLSQIDNILGGLMERKERIDNLDIRDMIASVYHPVLKDIKGGKHTFYNFAGGRGSGKSSFIALSLVLDIMQDPTTRANALIVRKYATTLRLSVYSQIQWAIDVLGVSDLWESTVTPMQFTYITGQTIRFTGLDDPKKLKSIKPQKGYYKILWIEEFSEIESESELRNLQQSILRGGDSFIVYRSYNPPISQSNWVNSFVDLEDDKSLTTKTTYLDMPKDWLGDTFILEAERLKQINERNYKHEYLGIPIGTGGQVFNNIDIRTITEDEINQLQYIYCGVDWGFSVDPCVFIRVAYERKTETVYFLDEFVKTELSNRQLAEFILSKKYHIRAPTLEESLDSTHLIYLGGMRPTERKQTIVCDSAEPKSIADLRGQGVSGAKACTKFAGCVEYRIKWLQSRVLVIDPQRTPIAYKEFSQYEYNHDKNGQFLSSVPDKDNHTIDAVAYALDELIYRKGSNRVTA